MPIRLSKWLTSIYNIKVQVVMLVYTVHLIGDVTQIILQQTSKTRPLLFTEEFLT